MFNLSETTVQLSHGGQRFFVEYTLGAGFKSKKHAGGRREVFASLFNFFSIGIILAQQRLVGSFHGGVLCSKAHEDRYDECC